jgi:hypothetical protein
MRTEREKMLAGELYDPLDPDLTQARERARDLCEDLNATREADGEARRRILRALFAAGGESVWMQPPTRDIPAGVLAVGNPCRVIREIAAYTKINERGFHANCKVAKSERSQRE